MVSGASSVCTFPELLLSRAPSSGGCRLALGLSLPTRRLAGSPLIIVSLTPPDYGEAGLS